MEIEKLYRRLLSKIRRWRRKPIKPEDKSSIYSIDENGYLRCFGAWVISFPDMYGFQFLAKNKKDAEIIINDKSYKIDL